MHPSRWLMTSALILALHAAPASAQFYDQHNLVTGPVPDGDLVNAWGLDAGQGTPWWIADNGTSKSTLYLADGTKLARVVDVQFKPTGLVFNPSGQFTLNANNNTDGKTGTPFFLFSTEEGTILAWNASGPTPNKATVVVTTPPDDSGTPAIYKGLAIGQVDAADATRWRLYATNFSQNKVDVFNTSFQQVTTDPPSFVDPDIPAGFAPFGIQRVGSTLYVTYAMQDEEKEDDVAGPGLGFVDAYDLSGNLITRVASRGSLNAPWGIAWASEHFGKYSGDLLIGNFGDGRIHAYEPQADGTYADKGPLHSAQGPPITIDGLWALQFGKNSANNGNDDQLFFTAGPDDESQGLFGFLKAAGPPGQNK
jgi:uncharacterized protein (TIGR03118 family)